MLRVLDLFSGIGGFSLGLERSGGFQTIAFCEIEPFCQKVLRKHWPDVPIFPDVLELSGDAVGHVDIITAGFPCQDISVAGKQGGLGEGTRSGLWSEVARLADELRPQYLIVENVPNLLSGPSERRGGWFGRVLGDLAEIGFDAEWHCLPASAVGAPHRRDRVWMVAYPTPQRRAEAGELRLRGLAEWFSGRSEAVVYSHSDEGQHQYRGGTIEHAAGTAPTDSSDDGQERTEGSGFRSLQGFSEFSWCEDVGSLEDIFKRPDLPPPLFRGARDGVPDWVDRVGGLGNSVVPQIPELIGRSIIEAESLNG